MLRGFASTNTRHGPCPSSSCPTKMPPRRSPPASRRMPGRSGRRASPASRRRREVTLAEARAPAAAPRDQAIAEFVAANCCDGVAPVRLAGDASFRRYYRVASGSRSIVLMDAPPPQEDVRPYIAVAGVLRGLGFSAPVIHAEDSDRGLLLIEDFGDDTYTRLLAAGGDETALYSLAIDTLVALHRAVAAAPLPDLPPYDGARLLAEVALLADWYAPSVM